MDEKNLNVKIREDLLRKAKAKASLQGLSLKEYLSLLIIQDTMDFKVKWENDGGKKKNN